MKRPTILGDRLGKKFDAVIRGRVIGRERSSEWYDQKFRETEAYHVGYQDSPYYPLWAVIVDRLRRDGIRRVLDIGCGPGQLAELMFDRGIDEYTGLDFSEAAIELARERAPAGRFIVGDARSARVYTDVEYDALVCTEVLEHIQDDLSVVRRFRPRIRCVFSVPNYPSEGHVRWFSGVDAVNDRYAGHFGHLDLTEFPIGGSATAVIYLADGYRNTVDADG
jgi:SAM-dependent methyltransferase